nr:hypothetical protein [Tanacetum cinerariifolium]
NNDIPKTESQKTSTDSKIVKDDDNVNGNDSHDDNVNGNDSHLFKSSVNSKTSYVGLDSWTMDPLEVAMEVERDVDSLERRCSTTSDKTTDSKIGQKRFDLNQEVCSEEVDNLVNPVSSTISFVSASQPTATSGLSSTPLQFEGILVLKESISTSALKPIIDGTHKNSKQRLDCLDFDLNATDGHEIKCYLLERNHL